MDISRDSWWLGKDAVEAERLLPSLKTMSLKD